MKLNINESVRVKLKPHGVAIHHRYYDGRCMPRIDAEGYTEYQIHQLMRIFGPHLEIFADPPFETTVEIRDESLKR